MSLSLKMLPCKKRRAVVAGLQSPRERGGAGEDGEPPGGVSVAGAVDGSSPVKPAAGRAAGPPPGWRGPGDAFLKGGKRLPAKVAPASSQESADGRPGAKDSCSAAELAEDVKNLEGGREGKCVPPVLSGVNTRGEGLVLPGGCEGLPRERGRSGNLGGLLAVRVR